MDELRAFLSKWDKANNSQREKILAEFVARSRDMTGVGCRVEGDE